MCRKHYVAVYFGNSEAPIPYTPPEWTKLRADQIQKVFYLTNDYRIYQEQLKATCRNVGVGPATNIQLWSEEKVIKKTINDFVKQCHHTTVEIEEYENPIHVLDSVVFTHTFQDFSEDEEEEFEGYGRVNQPERNGVFSLLGVAKAEWYDEDDIDDEEDEYDDEPEGKLRTESYYYDDAVCGSTKQYCDKIGYLLANAGNSEQIEIPLVCSCMALGLCGEFKASYNENGLDEYDIDYYAPQLPKIAPLPIKVSYTTTEGVEITKDYSIQTTHTWLDTDCYLILQLSVLPQ